MCAIILYSINGNDDNCDLTTNTHAANNWIVAICVLLLLVFTVVICD